MPTVLRNVCYRSSDGQVDYRFDFAYVGAGWRIYITDQPPYRGRVESSVASHRLWDATGPFICWDRGIETLNAAKGVAGLWADCTQNYISTGVFAPPPERGHVSDSSTTADWLDADRPGDPGLPSVPRHLPARSPGEPGRQVPQMPVVPRVVRPTPPSAPSVPLRPLRVASPSRPVISAAGPSRPRGLSHLFRSRP
jgi:hypothetical protein